MFHRNEIEVGDGRSIRDEFTIFVKGTSLIICFFIRMMRLRFGLGCGLVRLVLVA
jgi:hypothetical protein